MGNSAKAYLYIILLSVVIYLPFLGVVHLFDWDEINFAESAREMLVTGNWRQVTINYEGFWEKPPLFFWLQALSMSAFGVGEFAARFPNVLVSFLTLIAIFKIGKYEFDTRFSWWWVLLWIGSVTPQFYGHTGIIDPLFNLCMFLSVWQLYRSTKSKMYKPWLLAGVFLGLAVLTKGPVAILIVGLTAFAFWVINRFVFWFSIKHVLVFILITLFMAGLWLLPELVINGPGFLHSFIAYQLDLLLHPVASHGQPWFYHFLVLLIGCFPAIVIMIPSMLRKVESEDSQFTTWNKALFWVVLILFSLVTTKIVHYSSMCYLPATFIAAITLHKRIKPDKVLSGLYFFTTAIWAILLVAIPFIGLNAKALLIRYGDLIKDAYTKASFSVDVEWSVLHFLPGLLFVGSLYYVWRGWKTANQSKLIKGFVGNTIAIALIMIMITPAIEKHTQGEIISFYQSIEDEDCYVDVVGFKSYAHYFYSTVEPLAETDGLYVEKSRLFLEAMIQNTIGLNEEERVAYKRKVMVWLLNGEVDKTVYLICQERKIPYLEEQQHFKKILHRGGFAVFKRELQ